MECLCSHLDMPLVFTMHISVHSRGFLFDGTMDGYFRAARPNFRRAAAWVAISRYVRERLIQTGGIPPERVVVVRTGVDTEVFPPVPRPERETLEVLFVGQVMPEKGIGMLIESVLAASRHRKIRLRILGRGNFERILRRRTAGMPQIEWLGYARDRAAVAALYADANVVVMPTRWQEAFSDIPIEAMACGTPVTASDAGETGEAVRDGKTGRLFPPGDKEKLTRLLERVDAGQLDEMGRQGREFVLATHSNPLFARKYHELYRNVPEEPDHIRPID